MKSTRPAFVEKCQNCEFVQLCTWCPAYAYLETGAMDKPVDYFCAVSLAREKKLLERLGKVAGDAPAGTGSAQRALRQIGER
jgi:sulfatase maturation enzyme AslB (radical SAM superfamily)